jgi:hypothetical protein
LRTDVVQLGGLRNFVARFDIPFVAADSGRRKEEGLGDLYGQFLLTPYRKDNFYLAVGSGLTLPTASHDMLGGGKWQVVPTVAPIWRFQDPKALFVVKIQDFISFAGQDDRANIHYMTVTPVLAMPIAEQWWVAVDTEAKVNWEKDNTWSFKSGLIILRMWSKSFGISLKPEIPWGANREGDWNLKTSFFWNY